MGTTFIFWGLITSWVIFLAGIGLFVAALARLPLISTPIATIRLHADSADSADNADNADTSKVRALLPPDKSVSNSGTQERRALCIYIRRGFQRGKGHSCAAVRRGQLRRD